MISKRFLIVLPFLAALSFAGKPWVETDDAWLRHDIQVLADHSIIKGPTSTWPNMWSGIARDIQSVRRSDVPDNLINTFLRVRRAYKAKTRNSHLLKFSVGASSTTPAFYHFGDKVREKGHITLSNEWLGRQFAYNLQASYSLDPQDSNAIRFDGSYVAAVFYNWILSVGFIDRWWGPGWESSLIMSNNARPMPAIALSRNDYQPFESKWLSWIGPWRFTTFLARMEENRHIAHPLVWGARLSFKPFQSLEIGLSRTAQIAGDGRPKGLDTFWKAIIGEDNDGRDDNSEPGNQLAGYDARWHYNFGRNTLALYAQMIGEDEAGKMPFKWLTQAGISWSGLLLGQSYRLYFEHDNTIIDDLFGDATFNTAYEHGVYRTGYRYRSRSIGSPFESDARAYTLGLVLPFKNGHAMRTKLAFIDLNADAIKLGNTLSANNKELLRAAVHYRYPTQDCGIFYLGSFFQTRTIKADEFTSSKFGANLLWEYEI